MISGNRFLLLRKMRFANEDNCTIPLSVQQFNACNASSSVEFDEREQLTFGLKLMLTIGGIILILFTTFGNGLTIVAILRDRNLRTISNTYILSLALADFLVGSFIMTFNLLYTIHFNGEWVFGHKFCYIWTYLDFVGCTASLTNVLVIAKDMHFTVTEPFRAFSTRTRTKAFQMIFTAWSVPAVFWFSVICTLRLSHNDTSTADSCILEWKPKYLVFIASFIIIYLPVICIIALFTKIIQALRFRVLTIRRNSRLSLSGNMIESRNLLTKPEVSPLSSRSKPSDTIIMSVINKPNRENLSRKWSSTGALNGKYSQHTEETELTIGRCQSESHLYISSCAIKLSWFELLPKDSFYIDNFQRKWNNKHTSNVQRPSIKEKIIVNHLPIIKTKKSAVTRRGSTPESMLFNNHYATNLRRVRHDSLQRSRIRQQMLAAKTLGLIATVLLLSWLPYAVMWPLKTYCSSCISQRAFDISYWTNYMNSFINPIIYFLRNRKFRTFITDRLNRFL